MKGLAKLKILRNTPFDIFSYTAERKHERQLISDYEATMHRLLEGLNRDNRDLAIQIASLPEYIRGYGHVKERHINDVQANEKVLMEKFKNPDSSLPQAAE